MRDGSHSITVAGPVLYYLAATDKAATPLAPIKEFMSDHAVIMMVVPLVLGAKLPGQGLAGITPDTRPPGGDMLTALTDLPDNVLGFEASGEIHADDYTTILVPAIERRLAEGTDIRIVLVFEHWDGVSGGAARQDLKMGVEHLTRWKKIALVTDLDWMIHLTRLFGWMTPGELKQFPLAERDAAIAWASS